MTDQQEARLDALSAEDQHTLARAARVFAADRGISQQRAVEHCLDHAHDVKVLGDEITVLAASLRTEVRGQTSEVSETAAAPAVSEAAALADVAATEPEQLPPAGKRKSHAA